MAIKKYSKKKDGETYLSANFKVKEFACTDGSDLILIDSQLVRYLQQIRDYFKVSVTINNGYQTISHNQAVGGSPSSLHTTGQAADLIVKNQTPEEVAKYAESIGILGIGKYGAYVHIDTRSTKFFWVNGERNSVSTFGAVPVKDIIKTVQSTLNTRYNSKLTVDGKYGLLTREALIRGLQQEVGVTVDGKFGTQTKSSCPVLKKGSIGRVVWILQALLYANNYDPNGLDSQYGNGTVTAVQSFQKANNLTVDGIAGPNTFEVLLTNETTTIGGTENIKPNGRTIFIDAGHGGLDPGALGSGLQEKDLTLRLSLYQRELFESKGYTVIMSRSVDALMSLQMRTDAANISCADLFISNHVNDATTPSASGVEVYYPIGNQFGKAFAQAICQSLSSFFVNRGAKTRASADQPGKDYYHVIRETTMPALLIEHGFIGHISDAEKLRKDELLREMAKKAVNAIDALWPQDIQKI